MDGLKVTSRVIMGIGWMILPLVLLGAYFGNAACVVASKILLILVGGFTFLMFAAICWAIGLMILHGEFDGNSRW